jgi:hypothetical protein
MAMNNPDVSSSAPAEPAKSARPRTKRFWNWKLIGLEFIVVAVGSYGFDFLHNRLLQVVALLVALFGLWLLVREFRGLSVGAQIISLPSGRSAAFPLLSRGRRKVAIDALRELTVMDRWYSFEIATIQGSFGSEVLIFQTRGQRLRFMSAVEKVRPNVQMFRQKPPERGLYQP